MKIEKFFERYVSASSRITVHSIVVGESNKTCVIELDFEDKGSSPGFTIS